jgi:hypothetical protein
LDGNAPLLPPDFAKIRAASKAARNPLQIQIGGVRPKNDVGRLKDVPADGILTSRRPGKDFGTSRFKGSYSHTTQSRALMK